MQHRYYPRELILIGRLGVLLLIAAFVLSACGDYAGSDETGVESPAGESDVTFTGVITEVQDGTDGSTVRLEVDQATTVWATVSIPNLGPDSDFDFSALVVGSTITVTGETFGMDGETWLTAQSAAVVETAAGGANP